MKIMENKYDLSHFQHIRNVLNNIIVRGIPIIMITLIINIIKRWRTHVFLLLIKMILVSKILLSNAQSTTLSNIYVNDIFFEEKVTLYFSGNNPEYRFFPLHEPEFLVINLRKGDQTSELLMKFIKNNLVKRININQLLNSQYQRIDIKFINPVKVSSTVVKQINHYYQIVFILNNSCIKALQSQIFHSITEVSNKLLSTNLLAKKK